MAKLSLFERDDLGRGGEVEAVHGLVEVLGGDVQVLLGGADVTVPEQLADRLEVRALHQQVDGERPADGVGRALVNAGTVAHLAEVPAEDVAVPRDAVS